METVIGIAFLVLFALLWEIIIDHPLISIGVAVAGYYLFWPAVTLWFVGLPMLLTAAMPVLGPILVIAGVFVVAGWLFPKKVG